MHAVIKLPFYVFPVILIFPFQNVYHNQFCRLFHLHMTNLINSKSQFQLVNYMIFKGKISVCSQLGVLTPCVLSLQDVWRLYWHSKPFTFSTRRRRREINIPVWIDPLFSISQHTSTYWSLTSKAVLSFFGQVQFGRNSNTKNSYHILNLLSIFHVQFYCLKNNANKKSVIIYL
jgi:hypothetical protein